MGADIPTLGMPTINLSRPVSYDISQQMQSQVKSSSFQAMLNDTYCQQEAQQTDTNYCWFGEKKCKIHGGSECYDFSYISKIDEQSNVDNMEVSQSQNVSFWV
ncbi:hypothetical protein SS50377_26903 [Spironucleus salmonicida]|uniref:Uncharacterized protein n=1 Tax=Spironucleus salmonicida TaxID=348837 RepID=V6M2E6_9EUKA|nr:hypothetical protein SS50377_26903 [Spironucleus salmonicida]|eukprot:EST47414.1 Hypothetical protein SS50377_12400 [Spironucleus salmonicida]